MSDRTCRHCGFSEHEHRDINKLCPVYVTFDATATLEAENKRLAALVEWRTLLARAANTVTAEWGVSKPNWISVDGQLFENVEFSDGLPVEREDIKAALLAATEPPTTTAGR